MVDGCCRRADGYFVLAGKVCMNGGHTTYLEEIPRWRSVLPSSSASLLLLARLWGNAMDLYGCSFLT
jgi:hypothetical protein